MGKSARGFITLGIILTGTIAGISLGFSFNSSTVYAEKDAVPEWIKVIAGAWADGAITTDEFLNAINFLISNDIIKVPGYVSIDEINCSQICQSPENEQAPTPPLELNEPPTVSISSPGDGETRPAGTIPFALSIDDDGVPGGSITWSLSSDLEGLLFEDKCFAPCSEFPSIELLSTGSHTITLQADDGDLSSSVSITVNILPNPLELNEPPTVSISSPGDGETRPAGTIPFALSIDDDGVPGGSITWSLSSDLEGLLFEDKCFAPCSEFPSIELLSTGSHTITLQADDGDLSSSVSITFNIVP